MGGQKVEYSIDELTLITGMRDQYGNISLTFGTAAPSGKPGYTVGCIFVNTSTGAISTNTGTTSSCTFTALSNVTAGSVNLAALTSGITPSHVVKYAGKHTTLGGAAAEAFTVTGVATTDIVLVTLQAQGATPRTVLYAAPTLNTITVTFSGDPSTDHVISYMVLRAAS
jgi:hypothetical protein